MRLEKKLLKQIGQRLVEVRKDIGWTQGEMEGETGIDQASISQYETGYTEPSFKYLYYLWDEHNVSLDFVLSGQPPMYRFVKLHELRPMLRQMIDSIEKIDSILYSKKRNGEG